MVRDPIPARLFRSVTGRAGLLLLMLVVAHSVTAHPMVENALDVVIEPGRVVIEAKISPEEIQLVESPGTPRPTGAAWVRLTQQHAAYVRDHLRVKADEMPVTAASVTLVPGDASAALTSLVGYRIEYRLPRAPRTLGLDQTFLQGSNGWTASCILRIRQSTQPLFDTDLLTSTKSAVFDCVWPAGTETSVIAPPAPSPATSPIAGSPIASPAPSAVDRPAAGPAETRVRLGPTIRAYTAHGIMHILTGYDHLLFVSALVLAARSLWDLVKVVSAFTLAHTLTLTLSVFNIVRVGEHIVEPMIAASICFVAIQNVFWPRSSRGWTRLGIAFAFGLFHGLGFAGGLQEAMSSMPPVALWAALGAFSLGVEIGHQLVVIPLFTLLSAARNWNAPSPRNRLSLRIAQVCSIAICIAGAYYFVEALK